jgi:hypothetical protein
VFSNSDRATTSLTKYFREVSCEHNRICHGRSIRPVSQRIDGSICSVGVIGDRAIGGGVVGHPSLVD